MCCTAKPWDFLGQPKYKKWKWKMSCSVIRSMGLNHKTPSILFLVTVPMNFWVEVHILWSGISSPFHVYSMYSHHLYEFPVIKASVSSGIWSLCHTLFPSFNSPNTPSPTLFKTWICVLTLQSTHGPACALGLYSVPAQGSRLSSSLNWELLN